MSTLPFVVGQWVRGKDFYGRREILAEILDGGRDRLWLLGTRRIGKTSLLRQLEHLTGGGERGYFPLFWDFQGAESPEELAFELGDALLDAEDRLGSLGIRLDEAAAEDLFAGLELLRRELRARGLTLLLLCDEVEELLGLRRKDPAFLRQLRRTLEGEGIRAVLASAVRLWDLAAPDGDSSFLDGFTPPLHLRPLAAAEARSLIRQTHLPTASRPRFDAPAVETIRRACGDHPYLIQLVAKRRLELGDLAAAVEEVAADPMVRYFFAADFEMLSDPERRVLRRLARPGDGGAVPAPALAPPAALERLARLGYLDRDREGRWRIANAFFRRWLSEVPGSGPGAVRSTAARQPAAAPGESTVAGFPLGSTVGGRYRLREQVGEGASAVVFAADDTLLDARVAIKLLKPEVTATPALRERVRREILLARDIGHPNILRVYDLGTAGDRFYLTMQWVDGPTLAERIAAEAPFPRQAILAIGAELAAALEAAHGHRVLHRDIKPQNVLLAGERPLVTDFGLARALGKPGITGLGVFLGTPNYVSPEQANLDPLDERSDLYALGLVLYEMATGRRPFAGASMAEVLEMHRRQPAPDPRSIEPAVDADLSAVILRCLEKDPAARFASARALRQALERLMTAGDRQSETSALLARRSATAAGAADGGRSPESLLPLVYDELRQRARGFLARERRDHTLQPTALVHEAYLRLVDQTRVDWQGRTHFLAVGAQAMRRLLIDHARGHRRAKRGGDVRRVSLDESAWGVAGPSLDFDELLSVDQALAELRRVSERQATIVELRFFAGLKVQEIADHLELSRRTVQSEWARAKAWLEERLGAGGAR